MGNGSLAEGGAAADGDEEEEDLYGVVDEDEEWVPPSAEELARIQQMREHSDKCSKRMGELLLKVLRCLLHRLSFACSSLRRRFTVWVHVCLAAVAHAQRNVHQQQLRPAADAVPQ